MPYLSPRMQQSCPKIYGLKNTTRLAENELGMGLVLGSKPVTNDLAHWPAVATRLRATRTMISVLKFPANIRWAIGIFV